MSTIQDTLGSLGLGEVVSSTQSGFDTLTNGREIRSGNPNLDQSKYDFNYRTFPSDLGSDTNNHYMIININVPVTSDVGASTPRSNYYGNVFGQGGFFTSTILPNEFSTVDNLRFNPASSPVFGGNINAPQRELVSPQRSTRRIAESIAMYMPSPMTYTQLNAYEEISLTAIAGQVGKLGALPVGMALGAAAGAFLQRSIDGARRGSNAAGNLIDAAGNIIGTGFALAGFPINPRIEVLFSNTPQRQFNFEFLMAPRNETESRSMKDIIRTLRFHAAPEISTSLGFIPTFIPPAEFDITFYKNGLVNENIPRINTCVLERCEVDYSPTGVWSTFSNGQPVAARLSLAFREIEIVHKRRVVQGF